MAALPLPVRPKVRPASDQVMDPLIRAVADGLAFERMSALRAIDALGVSALECVAGEARKRPGASERRATFDKLSKRLACTVTELTIKPALLAESSIADFILTMTKSYSMADVRHSSMGSRMWSLAAT